MGIRLDEQGENSLELWQNQHHEDYVTADNKEDFFKLGLVTVCFPDKAESTVDLYVGFDEHGNLRIDVIEP